MIINIFTFVFLCSIEIISSTSYQPQTPILDTSQYHFIPNGSYLQYSLSSMNLQENQYNESISEFIVSFNISIVEAAANYNILIFPQRNPQSGQLYASYVKAVVQGISDLMPPISNNYTEPQTKCSECYQDAVYKNIPTACLNCSQTQYIINMTSIRWSELNMWNNTFLTIIDNSPVITQTGGYIELFLAYNISIAYDEEYYALFILFFSVIGAFIIILITVAIFLTLSIKKVDKALAQQKQERNLEAKSLELDKKIA